jgi:hypothetical protein
MSDFVRKNNSSEEHDENDAIIIMSGKNIRRHKQLINASLYDITPTVLYLLGMPVAIDMKGRVLAEALNKGYFYANPIRYIDTYETAKEELPRKPVRSPEDEKIIKERMRSLGYIN